MLPTNERAPIQTILRGHPYGQKMDSRKARSRFRTKNSSREAGARFRTKFWNLAGAGVDLDRFGRFHCGQGPRVWDQTFWGDVMNPRITLVGVPDQTFRGVCGGSCASIRGCAMNYQIHLDCQGCPIIVQFSSKYLIGPTITSDDFSVWSQPCNGYCGLEALAPWQMDVF